MPALLRREVAASIKEGERIFDAIDTSKGPTFLVEDVTKTFFAKSGSWLRLADRDEKIILDGERYEIPREQRGEKGEARILTITDVERLIYGLASTGHINERQRSTALLALVGIASVWGFLT